MQVKLVPSLLHHGGSMREVGRVSQLQPENAEAEDFTGGVIAATLHRAAQTHYVLLYLLVLT